jgi:hypothetical protein
MTVMQYLKNSGVGTALEFMQLGKADKASWESLKQQARDEMAFLNIPIE